MPYLDELFDSQHGSAVTYHVTETILAELTSVVRSTGDPYDPASWRPRQVGTWGKLAFSGILGVGYIAKMEKCVLPDGTRPDDVGTCFHAGVGETSVEHDTVTIKTANSIWRWRALGEDECKAYAAARTKFESERQQKAEEAHERFLKLRDSVPSGTRRDSMTAEDVKAELAKRGGEVSE